MVKRREYGEAQKQLAKQQHNERAAQDNAALTEAPEESDSSDEEQNPEFTVAYENGYSSTKTTTTQWISMRTYLS